MFDRAALIAACATHGRVARVVIAQAKGSAPREVGAAMLVWAGGQSGTIGGGTLEYELAQNALRGGDRMSRHALGPDMGQCCGGMVIALTEVYDVARAQALPEDIIARGPGEMPLPVARALAQARNAGTRPAPARFGAWMIEPVHRPSQALWIWGAGHVGRALVDVLAPLPDLAITWVDTGPDRFPHAPPAHVTVLPAKDPITALPYAPRHAHHLILTYSHSLDLALCDAVLRHGFASAGLIGSATKWARFRKRLAQGGHPQEQIARITCPIGDPSLGKAPQLIAIGVAHSLAKYGQIAQHVPIPLPNEAHA